MATNKAYAKKKRTNRGGTADSGAITSSQNNAYSGGQKNVPVGPEFLKQDTNAFTSGRNITAAGEPVYPGSTLYIYNNAGAIAWVTLSTANIAAAPTGFTDGIPLPPNSWTVLSAGENNNIRASAATVGLYEMKDDTVISDEN